MKTIKTLSILILSLITIVACNDEQLNVDNWDGNTIEGGLLDVKNKNMNYVVGNQGPYFAKTRVYQGDVKTGSVRISKTFYTSEKVVDPDTGESETVVLKSNTIDEFRTVSISDTDQNSFFDIDFTFSELIDGLSINGSPLPANDGEYTIGDYWELEYFSSTSTGEHKNYASTQVTVSTRFAGTYLVKKGEYFRLGANNGGGAMWTSEYVSIKSIDAITYQWAEWGILSGWADNVLYFQIDPNTLEITYPEEWDGIPQTLNGEPLMTPSSHPNDLSNVIGLTTTPNQAFAAEDGKDILDMVYGYYTGGSGPREFYHLLEKVVE